MSWIESHQTLARHPKTRKFARLANISIPQAIGHLHCLWWWATDYAQNGDLTAFDNMDIADASLWEGDPDVFVSALASCGVGGSGFLDVRRGGYVIHDWAIYAGKLIERRKADAARKKTERRPSDMDDIPFDDVPFNKEGTSTGCPPDIPRTADVPTYIPNIPNRTVPTNTPNQQHQESSQTEAVKETYPADAGKQPEKAPEGYSPQFESEFWKPYPKRDGTKKGSKADAWTVFKKLTVAQRSAACDMVHVYAKLDSTKHENGHWVIDAERWLREKRWETAEEEAQAELEQKVNGGNKNGHATVHRTNGYRDKQTEFDESYASNIRIAQMWTNSEGDI